jgi:hypothetical protein
LMCGDLNVWKMHEQALGTELARMARE